MTDKWTYANYQSSLGAKSCYNPHNTDKMGICTSQGYLFGFSKKSVGSLFPKG